MLNAEVFKHMNSLDVHRKLCFLLLEYFRNSLEIDGAFISGSGAAGGMDRHSDLDLGFLCSSIGAKEKIWSQRFEWPLPAWFHRMDADHVKPYFIIYLFEPEIHVDLAFYTLEDLPSQAGGPFAIAFDKKSQLERWLSEVNKPQKKHADWSNVVHEEERFWTWIHYSWCHTGRGEYYDCASTFGMLRSVIEEWHARLNGAEKFDTRRLEQKGGSEFAKSMHRCFPVPERASLKAALVNLIEIHESQRARVEKIAQPIWKTSDAARDKIKKLISEL